MRQSGFVDTAEGLGRHDHVCWTFDDPAAFRREAARFLADGLAAGQRVLYLSDGDADAELAAFDGFAAAAATGAARAGRIGAAYAGDAGLDPDTQARAYAQATEEALAAGYTGLRVAADVTSLVRTDATRAVFARYEHLVDRYMTGRPFAALCGYHRTVLGAAAVAEVACLHPLASRGATPLRLFPSAEPAISAVLAGEVDLAGHELLATALRRAEPPLVDGALVLDARGLSFIDHRGLFGLAAYVGGRGATAVLHVGEHSPVHLLTDLLEVPGMRVLVS